MASSRADPYRALFHKLAMLNSLSAEELDGIKSLPLRPQRFRAGATIISSGQLVSECCLLVEGYACRHKLASDGGRQIVSFHVAGDILDIQHLLFEKADHNVQTITDAEVVFFPMRDLRRLIEERPEVGKALWRDCLVDASIFREWVLNVGRRDARMRIAHMLCEFAAKCEAAGLGSPAQFTLPMTQEDIGDATGLTSVHVNRMLRQLADEGLIARAGREIRIADWPRMQEAADFQPDYLHLAA
ncbi:CRP-like cAMP-binding protein [Sphingomonas naasensis]|uniref:Crp/Fnr family transcriptional regulator n=1 Tax=Sphingomonas naasensis TaxID=1344951 RepID=A0A4S1WIA9_9SPHN|nr:Crp/Fnr family transcriptional regulator [Sphingomonas naasensis]NIJ22369.1 CRP-like cAMP-binding protein [Sphingomonas naasensis]TGX40636.1 Crp/Fnr family transcriptional regulator [Sphingomonas naasensis]